MTTIKTTVTDNEKERLTRLASLLSCTDPRSTLSLAMRHLVDNYLDKAIADLAAFKAMINGGGLPAAPAVQPPPAAPPVAPPVQPVTNPFPDPEPVFSQPSGGGSKGNRLLNRIQ